MPETPPGGPGDHRVVRVFRDPDCVAREAAELIAARVAATPATRNFTLALAGGATPRLLYRLLAGPEFRGRIAWERCEFFWGDERNVPADHPDSNFRMAHQTLLGPLRIRTESIHRLRGESDDLPAAARAAEKEIGAVFAVPVGGPPPRFDLVLLGMGADGHTASLFPGTAALREDTRWVVANEVPALDTRRLTLTYPVLNAAAAVLFLVCGAEKAEAVADILDRGAPVERRPAQGVTASHGSLSWFVDEDAASRLRRS